MCSTPTVVYNASYSGPINSHSGSLRIIAVMHVSPGDGTSITYLVPTLISDHVAGIYREQKLVDFMPTAERQRLSLQTFKLGNWLPVITPSRSSPRTDLYPVYRPKYSGNGPIGARQSHKTMRRTGRWELFKTYCRLRAGLESVWAIPALWAVKIHNWGNNSNNNMQNLNSAVYNL